MMNIKKLAEHIDFVELIKEIIEADISSDAITTMNLETTAEGVTITLIDILGDELVIDVTNVELMGFINKKLNSFMNKIQNN